jgi:hypothetical protein
MCVRVRVRVRVRYAVCGVLTNAPRCVCVNLI